MQNLTKSPLAQEEEWFLAIRALYKYFGIERSIVKIIGELPGDELCIMVDVSQRDSIVYQILAAGTVLCKEISLKEALVTFLLIALCTGEKAYKFSGIPHVCSGPLTKF